MPSEKYLVFSAKDGGGCFIKEMSREELEKALVDPDDLGGRRLLKQMPDWDYAEEKDAVIIKGEIVIPREVQVVTKLELP